MAKGFTSKTRAEVAKLACAAYKESIDNYIREAMKKTCQTVVHDAVVWRRSLGHQYTGNLVNSICGGVYEGGGLVYAYYAFQDKGMKEPIQNEMTAPRFYHFDEDWEGEESDYLPAMKTDQWYGNKHALSFIYSYQPTSTYFEVVIAYTADYAALVEEGNHSTGYEKALQDMNYMMLDFQKHADKGINWSSGGHGWHVVLKKVNVTG